jgi:hypothetical protein
MQQAVANQFSGLKGALRMKRKLCGLTIATIPFVMLVVAFAGLVSAGEIDLPDDIRDEVKTRRGKTVLSKLAAEMRPGTWAELNTEMPEGLWKSPKVDGRGGLHIAGWTDDAHWDSRTGQYLYMGLRQTRRFIAYSEEKNAWRDIPLDRNGDNPVFQTKFGHVYGTNAFDPNRSRFYHLYRDFEDLQGGISYFDVVAEKWTKLPSRPAGSGGMCIEYFSARNSLVVLGKQIVEFDKERREWHSLGDSPVDGYHSMFRHNPFREEVLMGGGNQQPRTLARLKKDGTIERLKDAPVPMGIGSDKVTIDPASGRYLIWAGNKGEPKGLYEFDSDRNEFRKIEEFAAGWPFGRYAMPVPAFIPEYGVTMWAENEVYLYKHDADRK